MNCTTIQLDYIKIVHNTFKNTFGYEKNTCL